MTIKRKSEKIFVILAALVVIGGLVLANSSAVAQIYDDNNTDEAPTTLSPTNNATDTTQIDTSIITSGIPPVLLNIDANGNALLRGFVQSVNSDSITVSSWIGPWTIQTTDSTQVIGTGNTVITLTDIEVGDYVGTSGTVSEISEKTLDSNIVRVWAKANTSPTDNESIEDTNAGTTTESTGTVNNTENLFTGRINNIQGNTFDLIQTDGTFYTVSVDQNTVFWNNARQVISLSNINSGDEIRINGTLIGSTINATVVRDISI